MDRETDSLWNITQRITSGHAMFKKDPTRKLCTKPNQCFRFFFLLFLFFFFFFFVVTMAQSHLFLAVYFRTLYHMKVAMWTSTKEQEDDGHHHHAMPDAMRCDALVPPPVSLFIINQRYKNNKKTTRQGISFIQWFIFMDTVSWWAFPRCVTTPRIAHFAHEDKTFEHQTTGSWAPQMERNY